MKSRGRFPHSTHIVSFDWIYVRSGNVGMKTYNLFNLLFTFLVFCFAERNIFCVFLSSFKSPFRSPARNICLNEKF